MRPGVHSRGTGSVLFGPRKDANLPNLFFPGPYLTVRSQDDEPCRERTEKRKGTNTWKSLYLRLFRSAIEA